MSTGTLAGGLKADASGGTSARDACEIWATFQIDDKWAPHFVGMPAEWEILRDGTAQASRDYEGQFATTHKAEFRVQVGASAIFGSGGTHMTGKVGGAVFLYDRSTTERKGRWVGHLKVGNKIVLTNAVQVYE